MALVENKKAKLHFEVRETLEAGIELRGFEAKSLFGGLGSLEGAKVIVRGGEAFVVGSYIPAYQQANTPKSYDPYRTRRLLLSKKQIEYIATAGEGTGLSIVPLAFYHKGLIKLEIALCRAKNKADKREALREKDDKRMMRKVIFGE